MTQRNLRGAYMPFTHDRQADWDWLAKWQPNVIRLMLQGNHTDPASVDVNRIRRVHETVPDATILLRVWDVDDRNFEAHDAMVADPHGEADRQVDWWASVFNRAAAAGIPRHLLMAGLNNETGPEKDAALYPYTEWALKYGIKQEVRLGVFVFSVGRPSLPGEGQAFDIEYFERLQPLIQQNNGAIVLHEYMQPEGMYAVWTDNEGRERRDYPYLMGRHTNWAVNVPIIIGEWGIDGILYNRHPDPGFGNSGWRNFKADWPPSRYADEYVECVRKASDNVIGICPFISDWADHKWQSFDLIEAYGEFLARKDLCVREIAVPPTTPDAPPVTIHLPTVSTGPQQAPKTMFVNAPNGVNIRKTAPDGEIITAVPYGDKVEVTGRVQFDDDNVWSLVNYNGQSGYVFARWLSATKPVPTQPAPTPTGDNWQRSITFILKEEGGYTANDEGNPANFGINQGANPDLDVAHITREQAIERYRTGYWIASGADKLDWPFCLLVMDAAVQHGAGEARMLFRESGGDMLYFQGARQLFYGQIKQDSWQRNGSAWMARMGRLLVEASKP